MVFNAAVMDHLAATAKKSCGLFGADGAFGWGGWPKSWQHAVRSRAVGSLAVRIEAVRIETVRIHAVKINGGS